MFTKLLKHEFKSQAGLLSILSAAALGAGLLGSGVMWYIANVVEGNRGGSEIAIGMFLAMLLFMGMIFLIAAYSIAVTILLVYRFYKRHFSDEGYLTFTLPATTHQLLLSSIANIAIWSLISVVVVFLSGMMMISPMLHMTGALAGESFFEMWSTIMSEFGFGTVFLQVFAAICSGVGGLILPLISVTLGALAVKKYKLLAGFGIYYGINMILSTLMGILSMVTMIGDITISESAGNVSLGLTTLIPSLLYLGIGIGGYFLMHYLVDKKLNLP